MFRRVGNAKKDITPQRKFALLLIFCVIQRYLLHNFYFYTVIKIRITDARCMYREDFAMELFARKRGNGDAAFYAILQGIPRKDRPSAIPWCRLHFWYKSRINRLAMLYWRREVIVTLFRRFHPIAVTQGRSAIMRPHSAEASPDY